MIADEQGLGEDEFAAAVANALASGSVIALGWAIYHGESGTEAVPASQLSLAKAIERRWREMENDNGEGALLVEDSEMIRLAAAVEDGRFSKKPQLLRNSERLRAKMGPYNWIREHQIDYLASVLGYSKSRP